MHYPVQQIAAALQAQAAIPAPAAIIEHIITDSRRIVFPASSLFFAIHTKRRNGHSFVNEVYERGVRNFVVEKTFDSSALPGANFIFTGDTLDALQQLAAWHRAHFAYPVIGITGSNGKTVVKEWLYQLLSPMYNIVRSPRSYNSQTGVPLSVWEMSAENTLAIFEAGISEPGEMEKLEAVIKPTIGVLTNIGEAHGENFINYAQKFYEKLLLFKHCKTVIGREADFYAQQAFVKFLGGDLDILTWGYSTGNYFVVQDITKLDGNTRIAIHCNNKVAEFSIPFTDNASIENAITCMCVCIAMKIDLLQVAMRMQQLQPVDMRLQLVQAINNCAVINDSYSFDITSFSVALDFLLQQHQFAQKTVIISDIPGNTEEAAYRQVADMLQAKHVTRVVAIGRQWEAYSDIIKNAVPVTQHYSGTASFVLQFSNSHFRNEAILLKGARAFGFETIAALLERKVHQTVMEINLSAMAHNLGQYRQQLAAGVKLMAMVKAFGYGSGGAEVANLLQFHKVDYLAVAYADEGIELRKAGISLPIMVMNIDAAAFEALVQYDLEPELFSFSILNAFTSFLKKHGMQQYPVHIKIDTGMHRLGFEAHDIPALTTLLAGNQQLVVKSVFSHLASSEDKNEDAFTQQQAHILLQCCADIQKAIGYPFIRHISNSAAIFRNPALQLDMVRLGIGLYGVDPAVEHQLQLQTVATLKTTIAQLRQVKAGDTVGYNRKGRILQDTLIATIRIGYADGFDRRLSNGIGSVYVNGVTAPVIGTVAMDMTMVDVTNVPGIEEDVEIEVLGPHIPVQQVAAWCGTIPYEILTGISQRVKRVYVEE
ncbi:MAG TPA: bifunctional UDP-N-acetylmuramoyl-tripeptide:D-alanyl-D-alanine ligase/alanine racemase [Chitinophagaceae bacterium]|nr:bifunctional UDP-N-acetylmuramoyl-tripeptide:D-alanyl-D-alanine ligase/alanine racemase [Chitinophagaceae bacterium]